MKSIFPSDMQTPNEETVLLCVKLFKLLESHEYLCETKHCNKDVPRVVIEEIIWDRYVSKADVYVALDSMGYIIHPYRRDLGLCKHYACSNASFNSNAIHWLANWNGVRQGRNIPHYILERKRKKYLLLDEEFENLLSPLLTSEEPKI